MIKTFSITDIGRKRKINQDYVFTSEQSIGSLPNLFIVADGMGGHKAGDFASKCTVETMTEEIRKSSETDSEAVLRGAISAANTKIRKLAMENEALSGMGTTVVAALCDGDELLVANVGDSRLYVVNDTIRQITVDHSLVEEMVRAGSLDREAARIHPDKNVITRAVGAEDTVEPDFFRVNLKPQDLVLLCSDGLSNMLEDKEIRLIIEGARDLVEKAQALVGAANRNGGKDNISVVLVQPFAG